MPMALRVGGFGQPTLVGLVTAYGRVGTDGTMPLIFARGLVRSTRIGSRVTTSLTFPAASRAVAFRYTRAGMPAGTRHAYCPVFASRFATGVLIAVA